MTTVAAPVLEWARTPGPARALRTARDKWEAGARGARVVLCADATDQERRDLGRLLGLSWQTSGRPLRLGPLRRALAGYQIELPELLTALGGPLRDRPAERDVARACSAQVKERVRRVLVDGGVPSDAASEAVAGRWLGPTETALALAGQVVAVWRQLPVAEGTLLAELAAGTFGDPHALDRRFRLGGLVLRLWAYAGSGQDPGPIRDAFARRWAWTEVGVTYDRVSSLVLVLNLPLPPGSTAARLCATAVGEPLWLTLRTVPSDFVLPARSLAGCVVRVCENPTVVEAAADRLGTSSRPLVCTFGQVSVTGISLLTALASAGANLLITGDRDEPGKVITAGLLSRFPGARRWLPELEGQYEEDRLGALLADLRGSADDGLNS